MRKFIRKISLCTLIIVLMFSIIACTKKTNTENESNLRQNEISTSLSTESSNNNEMQSKCQETIKTNLNVTDKSFDVNELKSAIKNALNDLNWYNGSSSELRGLENKKFDIEIYINNKNSIWVIASNKSINKYYAILFSKNSKGYINEPLSYYVRDNSNKNSESVSMEKNGYYFYTIDEIEFGATVEPTYPTSSVDKEKVFGEMEKLIPGFLKGWGQKPGVYNAYMRNYRDNDIHTNIVIENAEGKSWILDVNLGEDGTTSQGKFYEVKNDNLKYEAEQFKKVAIIKREVKVE